MISKQEQHEAVICRFVNESPAVLYDIGVGPKSEWRTLGRRYPDMRVVGCEPHPQQYNRLLQAGFPGPLANVAIGEREGTATLYAPTNNIGCASLHPIPYGNSSLEVKVWTLDRFDQQMGRLDKVLLWLDIEGGELSALRSGPQLIASGRVRWINLEERRGGYQPTKDWCKADELHDFLTSHGYVRVCDYNRHNTHQDAIYIHHEEPPC